MIPAKVTCQLFPFRSFVLLILSKDFKGQWIILKIHSCLSSYFIRVFKQRCFWATQCQPEVSLLISFNMPWSCQICIAMCLYSYSRGRSRIFFRSRRGALVSCSTSTPINHTVFFFWQNTSCIRKLQVISGRGGAHPLHPPPRSVPV